LGKPYRQAELSRRTAAPKPQTVATRTIVVAAAPLRFGTHVDAGALREVTWPDDTIPAGTYGSIAEIINGGKRIVLASIERNEPILRTKSTGPGQKATLSAVIQDGMRAVTVRVNGAGPSTSSHAVRTCSWRSAVWAVR